MARYKFLIKARDTQPFWVDYNLSTSGDAINIANSFETSGVIDYSIDPNSKVTIYHKYPANSINSINIYYPEN